MHEKFSDLRDNQIELIDPELTKFDFNEEDN